MDWMFLIIGFSLVLVGAAFFGFPVGYVYARRQFGFDTGREFVLFESHGNGIFSECRQDVLSAEFIEEREKKWV